MVQRLALTFVWGHLDIGRTTWRSFQVYPKPRDWSSRTEKYST